MYRKIVLFIVFLFLKDKTQDIRSWEK